MTVYSTSSDTQSNHPVRVPPPVYNTGAYLYNNPDNPDPLNQDMNYVAGEPGGYYYQPLPPGHSPSAIYQDPTYFSLQDFMMSKDQKWSGDQIANFQKLMVMRGAITGKYALGQWDQETKDAMTQMIAEARDAGVTLGQWITPSAAALAAADASTAGTGNHSTYYAPTTNTRTTVQLTSRGNARALLTNVLQAATGRDPTKAQVDAFIQGLHAKEEDHPQVTQVTTPGHTTSTSVDGTTTTVSGGDTSSRTVVDEGLNPEAYADRWGDTHNLKEQQRYQSGHYMQIIDSMLGV